MFFGHFSGGYLVAALFPTLPLWACLFATQSVDVFMCFMGILGLEMRRETDVSISHSYALGIPAASLLSVLVFKLFLALKSTNTRSYRSTIFSLLLLLILSISHTLEDSLVHPYGIMAIVPPQYLSLVNRVFGLSLSTDLNYSLYYGLHSRMTKAQILWFESGISILGMLVYTASRIDEAKSKMRFLLSLALSTAVGIFLQYQYLFPPPQPLGGGMDIKMVMMGITVMVASQCLPAWFGVERGMVVKSKRD